MHFCHLSVSCFTRTSAKPVFLQAHLRLMDCVFAVWLDISDERVGKAVLQERTDSMCEKCFLNGICTTSTKNPLF